MVLDAVSEYPGRFDWEPPRKRAERVRRRCRGAKAGKKKPKPRERSANGAAKSGSSNRSRSRKRVPRTASTGERSDVGETPSGISLDTDNESGPAPEPADEFADDAAADAEVARASGGDNDENEGDADFHPLGHGDRETTGHSGPDRF